MARTVRGADFAIVYRALTAVIAYVAGRQHSTWILVNRPSIGHDAPNDFVNSYLDAPALPQRFDYTRSRMCEALCSRFFCIGLYLAVFMATRLPFFCTHFIIDLDGDYSSYAGEAEKIFNGIWPDFSIRPPLYPLMLAGARQLGFDAFGVLLAQSLLTAVTGSAFIFATNRWRNYTVVALIALLGAHCSEQWLLYETTMSADSIYANLLLLFIAALMLLVASKNWHFAIVASTLAGLAVWARPAGVVLIAVEVLLVVFLLVTRAGQLPLRTIAALLAPSLVLTLSLNAANYFGISKRFEFSIWGEMNLAAATMFLWEERGDYPETLNKDIARIRALIPDHDMEVIKTEWSPEALYSSFYSAFSTYYKAQRFFPHHVAGPENYNIATYMRERPVIRSVAMDAIAAEPRLYLKFVYMNLYHYLTNNRVDTFRPFLGLNPTGGFFGSPLKYRLDGLIHRSKIIADGGTVWFFGSVGVAEVKGSDGSAYQYNDALKRTAEVWFILHNILYRNWLWPLAFFASIGPIALSAVRRNDDFLVVGGALLLVLGSATLTSLVEIAITRYSSVTLPQFYFCGAFAASRVWSFMHKRLRS